MSTQYSVVNTRITEEVAEFQKKVSAIRAECLRMMREASVLRPVYGASEVIWMRTIIQ